MTVRDAGRRLAILAGLLVYSLALAVGTSIGWAGRRLA